MKTYVTFGQDHQHDVLGKVFNKDCVAVIECDSPDMGRSLAFAYFGTKFCMEYTEEHWDASAMDRYYPRGYIEVKS